MTLCLFLGRGSQSGLLFAKRFFVLLFLLSYCFSCGPLSGEHVMCPSQSHSGSSATGQISDPGGQGLGSGRGPGIRTDLNPRPPQQIVYVFTTSLANRLVCCCFFVPVYSAVNMC